MDILSIIVYKNSVLSWIISFAIIVGSVAIGKLVYIFLGTSVKALTLKTKTKLDDVLIDMLEEPFVFAMVLTGIWFALKRLVFEQGTLNLIDKGFDFLIIINVTWLIQRLIDAFFKEYLLPIVEKTENDLDDQIFPIVRRTAGITIWGLGLIVALENLGYKIGPLLAGLGIGGIALAMAAKDTVSNIFGGVTILVDKPFKIKDRIKINGYDGNVEEIGLRSTRIRTLAGTLVTIPNSKFTESPIENVTLEPSRKITLNLGVTYDTKPEKIEEAIKILKEIAEENSEFIKEKYLLSFNEFKDFSLGIFFIYYIKKSANILDTQTKINLEILKRFKHAKISMAFPTQTIEIKK